MVLGVPSVTLRSRLFPRSRHRLCQSATAHGVTFTTDRLRGRLRGRLRVRLRGRLQGRLSEQRRERRSSGGLFSVTCHTCVLTLEAAGAPKMVASPDIWSLCDRVLLSQSQLGVHRPHVIPCLFLQPIPNNPCVCNFLAAASKTTHGSARRRRRRGRRGGPGCRGRRNAFSARRIRAAHHCAGPAGGGQSQLECTTAPRCHHRRAN